MNPDTMAAGNQMDRIIAEKLMDLHIEREEGFSPNGEHEVWRTAQGYRASEYNPPAYSSDMRAAMAVAEKFGTMFELVRPLQVGRSKWRARFSSYLGTFEGEADDPALAICRAALKKLEGT